MNIGNLIKLIGDVQPAAGRTLELRPGQIVRAQVLELTGEKEALLQIGGTQLVAKLETPLKAGQTAMLQVESETSDGMLVLKQQESKSAESAPSDEQWGALASKLGLKGKEQGAQALMSALKAAGLPLSSSTAAALEQAAGLKPANVEPEQWLKAAVSVIQRGLPVTEATVTAMRQVISGPPLHELLQQLSTALEQGAGGKGGGQAAAAVAKLLAQLDAGADWLQGANTPTPAAGDTEIVQEPSKGSGASPVNAGKLPLPDDTVDPSTLDSAEWTDPGSKGAVTGSGKGAAGQGRSIGADMPQERLTGNEGAAEEAVETLEPGKTGGGSKGSPAQAWPRQLLGLMGAGHENQLLRSVQTDITIAGRTASVQENPGEEAVTAAALSTDMEAATARSGTFERAGMRSGSLVLGQMNASQSVQPQNTVDMEEKSSSILQGAEGKQGNAGTADSHISAQGNAAPLDTQTKTTLNSERLVANPASTDTNESDSTPIKAAEASMQSKAGQGASIASGSEKNQAVSISSGQEKDQSLHAGAAPKSDIHSAAVRNSVHITSPPSGGIEGGSTETASLKSTLLTLLQASDLSPQLKDSAQQLLQHITGQQLLLTPERNGAFFSQIALQIPLMNQDGGGTASVHIQSRRNGKGGLDASNCRLLFDLELSALGSTLVDVSIMDRVVSLTVYSDHPAVPLLAEAGKQALTDMLQESGYQLLGLRTASPQDREQLKDSSPQSSAGGMINRAYKGVDLRA